MTEGDKTGEITPETAGLPNDPATNSTQNVIYADVLKHPYPIQLKPRILPEPTPFVPKFETRFPDPGQSVIPLRDNRRMSVPPTRKMGSGPTARGKYPTQSLLPPDSEDSDLIK